MYNIGIYILFTIFLGSVLVPPVQAVDSCLNQNGPLTRITGIQQTAYDKRSTFSDTSRIDATGAVWQNVGSYAIQLGSGSSICFYGATVNGAYAPTVTWETMHGTSALYIQGQGFTIENFRVHNYGDAIRLRANTDNFVLRNIHLTYIRDDCIENDYMNGGLVDNSLFDGCYNAFSARPGSSTSPPDGSNKIWRIQNSLIRLESMEQDYRGTTWVHAGFFKWDKNTPSKSPKIALVNNIFRVDSQAHTVGLAIPTDKLSECSNNIMVWLGPGDYPEPLPATFNGKPCFTVTKNKSVWDTAVAKWTSSPIATTTPSNPLPSVTPFLSLTPTRTISPTITVRPSLTPTTPLPVTPSSVPTSTPVCPNKSVGDADCNNSIDQEDFHIFIQEFTRTLLTKKSDFNNSNTITLLDYEILRRKLFQ